MHGYDENMLNILRYCNEMTSNMDMNLSIDGNNAKRNVCDPFVLLIQYAQQKTLFEIGLLEQYSVTDNAAELYL